MMTILEFMSVDHDKLDRLFEAFNTLEKDDFDRASVLFLDFKAGLERHIAWEEEILFPIFERETGMRDAGPTAVMRTEHRHIEKYLEEIGACLRGGESQAMDEAETGLLGVLGPHNQKEENVLYPAIDDMAGEQEREQAIARMSATSADKLQQAG